MTKLRAPRLPWALALILAAAALPAPAADPVEPAVELETITVTAPVPPLDRSQHLLRLLVEQSTPCLGCDAVLRERRPPALSLLSYLLLPAEPPQVDEAARLALDIKLQDSPDLEYLRP